MQVSVVQVEINSINRWPEIYQSLVRGEKRKVCHLEHGALGLSDSKVYTELFGAIVFSGEVKDEPQQLGRTGRR